ncbi:hypothetical protein [Steroidobacter agaridevorans]|uniref:hypothetical protein n=1 Tax=Steroidobacter agaridevorans TaxID=2695856 RepID=UPI0013268487|nr:hypothetical protein [Steroidobacter agaridevorans]GFE89429.1 hypothetical protein GCM10011488_43830 [Steroidobacter agaridevorans]
MTIRTDLQHLSPEALAQASNAGIVKRAVRELEAGYRPQIALDASATLTATFSDGVVTTWANGKPIDQSACTCGAARVCRHRIIAALAYRQESSSVESVAPPKSAPPGTVTDEMLEKVIPAALMKIANEQRVQGISVDVRRQASGEPCDTARLPAATVRFWAGAAIEAARCDCVRAAACEHIALGVWAFRVADAEHAAENAVQVRLGDAGSRTRIDRTAFVALTRSLLAHGVVAGATPHVQEFTRAQEVARSAGAQWLRNTLDDLEHWAGAYAARSALYEARDGAHLLAELNLRVAAGSLPGRAQAVLGIGQASETELDRLRLMCLGARTTRDGDVRMTRMVLADLDTGTKFVLNKQWTVPGERLADEAALRASERVAPGVRMEQLAQGQLLAQHARRLADGTVRLAGTRSSQNSVLPQAADWSVLGTPLRFTSLSELVAQKRASPTAQIEPRHAAGRFVVFTPARVDQVLYDSNEQALLAVVCDQEDRPVLVRRTHESHVKHALDALAGAFTGQFGELRHVAGVLHWEQGVAIIEPWAIAADRVVVPDFSPACGALAKISLGHAPVQTTEPLAVALRQLRETVGALLHHGYARLRDSWLEDATQLQGRLKVLNLTALSQNLASFVTLVQQCRARAESVELAEPLLQLVALVQLHEDAQAVLLLGEQEGGS